MGAAMVVAMLVGAQPGARCEVLPPTRPASPGSIAGSCSPRPTVTATGSCGARRRAGSGPRGSPRSTRPVTPTPRGSCHAARPSCSPRTTATTARNSGERMGRQRARGWCATSLEARTPSVPEHPVTICGVTFFTAADGSHGRELWRTDGTHEGTWMLRDLVPGPITRPGARGSPARSDARRVHLRRRCARSRALDHATDSRAGTRIVEDIRPGPPGSAPIPLGVIDDRLLFFARDGVHGPELWSTDGTPDGTALVLDIAPGSVGSMPRFYAGTFVEAAVVGSAVAFAANDDVHGNELWLSDGTAGGTHLVADIDPRVDDPITYESPDGITVAGDPTSSPGSTASRPTAATGSSSGRATGRRAAHRWWRRSSQVVCTCTASRRSGSCRVRCGGDPRASGGGGATAPRTGPSASRDGARNRMRPGSASAPSMRRCSSSVQVCGGRMERSPVRMWIPTGRDVEAPRGEPVSTRGCRRTPPVLRRRRRAREGAVGDRRHGSRDPAGG